MTVQSANSRWGALVSTSPPIQCTAMKIGHKINERSDCDRSTQQPLVPPPRSSFLIGNSDFLPDQIKISLLLPRAEPTDPREHPARGEPPALHDPEQHGQCTTARGGCGGGQGNPSCGGSRGSGPFRPQPHRLSNRLDT